MVLIQIGKHKSGAELPADLFLQRMTELHPVVALNQLFHQRGIVERVERQFVLYSEPAVVKHVTYPVAHARDERASTSEYPEAFVPYMIYILNIAV